MKNKFSKYWGWSTLSEWGDGDRIPDGVRIPTGEIVELTAPAMDAAWRNLMNATEGRSKAKYAPMGHGVKAVWDSGGSSPSGRSGQRWMRMEVIAPKGSVFLYDFRCEECQAEIGYSDDPRTAQLCDSCQAEIDGQERAVEDQWRYIAEQERLADAEMEAW